MLAPFYCLRKTISASHKQTRIAFFFHRMQQIATEQQMSANLVPA